MVLAQRRLRLLFASFVGLLLLAVIRSADLGMLQGAHLSALAPEQRGANPRAARDARRDPRREWQGARP